MKKRRFDEPVVDARVLVFHTQSLSDGTHAVLSSAASQRPCKSNDTDQMQLRERGVGSMRKQKMIQMCLVMAFVCLS